MFVFGRLLFCFVKKCLFLEGFYFVLLRNVCFWKAFILFYYFAFYNKQSYDDNFLFLY